MAQQRFDAKNRVVPAVHAVVSGESMTKQSFTDEVDINKIVARATESGFIGHVSTKTPVYMDATSIPDYRSALDIVNLANFRFMELPALTRERFMNDPARFLDFCSKQENADEARKLGFLADPVKPVPPMKVEVINPVVPDPDEPDIHIKKAKK